jgi:carboxyl-terminal processing protease
MWKDTTDEVDRRVVLVKVLALLVVMFTLMLAAYLYGRSQSPAGISAENREGVVLYAEALKVVEDDYVGQEEIDPQEQTYGAIEGMLDSLGDEGHTRFLSPEEAEKSREALSSTYVGIGIRLDERDGEAVVMAPADGSPAEEAGIESGDVIVAVDGENVKEEDTKEIGGRIRGPEGTTVDLTMLRDDEEELEFSVERAELEVPVASWNLIPGTSVAHLRLATFSENSAEKLEGAVAMAQEDGAQSFVLDLRSNPGGLVEEAEEVAAQFLPAGSPIYVRRDAEGEEETTVPEENDPLDSPLVVLVDEGSSSSAEIVAGALRDNGRAEVVGETTFGTGTVLDEYLLSDGSAMLLAVAEWLTPNGDSIRGSGIEPNTEVELEDYQEPRTPDETKDLTREQIFAEDAQLEHAFEILREE